MKKIIIFLFSFLILNSKFLIPAHAACQPIYGGGEFCEQKGKITIDKTIKRPSDGTFVDSLSPVEPSFAPGNTIEFRVVVKNTDTRSHKNIVVTDVFPSSLSRESSPGNFDANTRTITIKIEELKKDESKTYTVKAKVNGVEGTMCFANHASVTEGRNINQDMAKFCITGNQAPQENGSQPVNQIPSTTKGGQPIYQPQQPSENPATGPEMIPLLALIPTALGGIFLRRKWRTI